MDNKGNKYCLGYKHGSETIKKMSENNSGKNNPMYGVSLSKDILLKRSLKVKKEGTFKGKNNPNFKYEITEKELYYFYITQNLKIDEIAKHYGCHRTVISTNLKKYEIIKPLTNKYNIIIADIEKYLNNGLSQTDIAKIYNCGNKYIHKIIKTKLNKNGK